MATIALRDYYVYILYREDGVTPFYVGKGRGDRWLVHEVKARQWQRTTSIKKLIIQEMQRQGFVVPKKKIKEGLSEKAALILEQQVIDQYGCIPHGLLANIVRGTAFPPVMPRSFLSVSTRAAWADPEKRARMSAWTKNPEAIARISKAMLGKKHGLGHQHSDQSRQLMSLKVRNAWAREDSLLRRTVAGSFWANNGKQNRRIKGEMPDGWKYGRIFTCPSP